MVLIGVHTTRGGEKMADFVREQSVPYPVAIDRDGATVKAFAVDSFPDYYLIDRAGNLRFADLANGELDRALTLLLGENAPSNVHPALAAASQTAQAKDKRILVAWDGAKPSALVGKDREFATFLRNEYEVVELQAAAHPDLAQAHGVGGTSLAVFDAVGVHLASLSAKDLDAAGLRKFLEAHRVPVKDAEVLWRNALAEAQREQKRILVHLGAPW